jgi:hypothetical protein
MCLSKEARNISMDRVWKEKKSRRKKVVKERKEGKKEKNEIGLETQMQSDQQQEDNDLPPSSKADSEE